MNQFRLDKRLFGLGSYAFRHAISSKTRPMDAEAFILNAADLGFQRVLACENLNFHKEGVHYFEQLKKIMSERNIIAETGMKGISLEEIKRHVEISSILGSPLLRLVIGENGGNTPEGKIRVKNDTCRVLEKVLPLLENNDLILGIENHFDLSTGDICDIVNHFNSRNIALIYDSTNGTGLLEKPFETLEKMKTRIVSAHIKNFISKKIDGGYYLAGTDLNEGDLDIKELVYKILEYNPRCSIIVEYNINPGKSMEENELLQWERDHIVINSTYLKSILFAYSDIKA